MAINRGKQFEAKVKLDLDKIPGISFDRIYDTQSGYKNVSNICDILAYKYPYQFYLEVKSHKGNTFPLTCLTQYKKLIKKHGIRGTRAGVILWLIDHDVVLYIPISTFYKLYKDDKKSFNFKMIGDERYKSILIPSRKLRTFLECDYSILWTFEDKDIQ